ncbi:MAG TPA: hypothetical protein VG873_03280 [Burkholderiales bacterium]|nr:hypothetical protein [Burkholderiales bacterium]
MERKDQLRNSNPAGQQQQPKQDGVEGEGSYKGSKDYNERTQRFVESGKVEDAARAAKPQSEEEAHQMHKAERIGKQHSKGEDGGLAKKTDQKDN